MRISAVVAIAVLLLLVGIALRSAVRAANESNSGTLKLTLERRKYNPGLDVRETGSSAHPKSRHLPIGFYPCVAA